MKLSRIVLASCFLAIAWSAYSLQEDALSESQIRELIRQSADKDLENTKREREYTYVKQEVQRRLDGKGQVKSSESKTYEVMILGGEPTEKLIAKDDKPLPAKEAKSEDDKIQKIIAKNEKESDRDRQRRLEKSEKQTEEDRQFVREIADAYKFRFLGVEEVGGRQVYVIDAEPLPDYKPRLKDAKVLKSLRFRAWVDKAEQQWVKLKIDCIDTISWGLFLARIHKGSTIQIEQTRVNDEVWLPKHASLTLDARIALLKNLDMVLDVTFRDYQKFRTDTVIR